jgi:hypothetical protein
MDSRSNIMGICFIDTLEIRLLARRMGRGFRGYGLWLQLRYLFRVPLKLLLHRMDIVDISRWASEGTRKGMPLLYTNAPVQPSERENTIKTHLERGNSPLTPTSCFINSADSGRRIDSPDVCDLYHNPIVANLQGSVEHSPKSQVKGGCP